MLKIYEINEQIENLSMNLVDEETGEFDELIEKAIIEKLNEKPALLEHYALVVKNDNNFIKEIDEEIKRLRNLKKHKQKEMEFFTEVIDNELQGRPWETPKVAMKYRKSTQVAVDAMFCDFAEKHGYADLVRTKVTKAPDKTMIKARLLTGELIDHCELVEKNNLKIT